MYVFDNKGYVVFAFTGTRGDMGILGTNGIYFRVCEEKTTGVLS
jgi:hypothetical protein